MILRRVAARKNCLAYLMVRLMVAGAYSCPRSQVPNRSASPGVMLAKAQSGPKNLFMRLAAISRLTSDISLAPWYSAM
jgi:hypothetical protein